MANERQKAYQHAYFKNLPPEKKAEYNEAHRIWQQGARASVSDRIAAAWDAETKRINNEPLPGAYEQGDE